MAYVKVGPWVNGAAPPISAANLDTIETQYDEAVTDLFLEYVGIVPPALSAAGGAGAWEDWDISAVCPAGAIFAEIKIGGHAGAVDYNCGVRKNGTALARIWVVSRFSGQSVTVELDSNRICERYQDDITLATFTVLGYWTR